MLPKITILREFSAINAQQIVNDKVKYLFQNRFKYIKTDTIFFFYQF